MMSLEALDENNKMFWTEVVCLMGEMVGLWVLCDSFAHLLICSFALIVCHR